VNSHIFVRVLGFLMTVTSVANVWANENGVVEFRKKHPDIAPYYLQLTPVAFESYEREASLSFVRIMGYVKQIRKRFPDITELQKYADTIEEYERDLLKRIESYLDNYRKNARPQDTIWEFTHVKEGKKEIGFLILNEGDIRVREVFLSEPYEKEDASNTWGSVHQEKADE
jgi:hypothetical protein